MTLDFEKQIENIKSMHDRLSPKEKEHLEEALQIIVTKFDKRT